MTAIAAVSPTLFHGPGPWGYGYHPGWFPFFPLAGFFVVALVLFVVLGAFGRRRMWRVHEHQGLRSAEADLARRFAAGEIDEQEYEHRVATLRRLRDG